MLNLSLCNGYVTVEFDTFVRRGSVAIPGGGKKYLRIGTRSGMVQRDREPADICMQRIHAKRSETWTVSAFINPRG